MRKKIQWLLMTLVLVTLPFTIALDCSGAPPDDVLGLLYVLDSTNDAVYVFENIDTLDGDQDPVRTISGDTTVIENPRAIEVDGLRDILYVADADAKQILVFLPASQKDGDVAPTRRLDLPDDANPGAMTLDVDNNTLYVHDLANQNIQIWETVSMAADGAVATQSFNINFIASSIFIDGTRDLLYVGDPVFMAVDVFSQASTLINDQSPTSIIQNSDVAFNELNSLTMNVDNDILFVSEARNPSVDIFDNASTLNGSFEPNRILTGGNTQLTTNLTQGRFLDNVFYQALSDTNIGIYDDANNLDGDDAPNRNIHINPATRIQGFAIDNRR